MGSPAQYIYDASLMISFPHPSLHSQVDFFSVRISEVVSIMTYNTQTSSHAIVLKNTPTMQYKTWNTEFGPGTPYISALLQDDLGLCESIWVQVMIPCRLDTDIEPLTIHQGKSINQLALCLYRIINCVCLLGILICMNIGDNIYTRAV